MYFEILYNLRIASHPLLPVLTIIEANLDCNKLKGQVIETYSAVTPKILKKNWVFGVLL